MDPLPKITDKMALAMLSEARVQAAKHLAERPELGNLRPEELIAIGYVKGIKDSFEIGRETFLRADRQDQLNKHN
jgi:hypothetical protein